MSTIFRTPDENTFHVRIRGIENLLAVILFPITIETEDLANLLVARKISKSLGER